MVHEVQLSTTDVVTKVHGVLSNESSSLSHLILPFPLHQRCLAYSTVTERDALSFWEDTAKADSPYWL